ncbi:MAG TPA: PadR family transcriptional regulator [Longimicrobiales bacterium]|jgi:transcriptional regulator|nr:PadR family transcriptional regulator [Longimicrobiales bacterium]
MPDDSLDVLQGTLELLILQTLAGDREMHGFAILDWIRETTGEELVIEEGALYPALHRMERRGWLTADWGISDKGRRAKYYRLTASGREALAREGRRWDRYVEAVARLAGRVTGG